MRRAKLVVTAEHATLALVEKQGGADETLVAAVQITRAELTHLLAGVGTIQAGESRILYSDGGGRTTP